MFSDDDSETEFSNRSSSSIVLRSGRKKLRLTMSLEFEEEEWENWLFEDVASKVGLQTRAFWVHSMYKKRNTDGEFVRICVPYRRYPEKFYKYFRMTVETFDYILASIQHRIIKHSHRPSIGPMERLALTLRYLSTGLSFQALSDSFLMSPYTVSLIVKEVCSVIYDELVGEHMPIPSPSDFQKIAEDYEEEWDFPNVIGAIDGKHIRIKCPPNSGSMFYNYKGFFSVVLQAVADSNYKFIFVDVGAYGKQGDAGTFEASSLNSFVKNPDNFPKDRTIPGITFPVPYLFVCDDAYPLRWNMLKPYSKPPLTPAMQIFNGRLSRARRCVECSFGILANKWRLLFREIETDLDTVCSIVKCATVLHNIIIDREGVDTNILGVVEEKLAANDVNRKKGGMNMGRRYNRSSVDAGKLREALTKYFNSEDGCVPWQDRYVK